MFKQLLTRVFVQKMNKIKVKGAYHYMGTSALIYFPSVDGIKSFSFC
jgi:hypothetical protein